MRGHGMLRRSPRLHILCALLPLALLDPGRRRKRRGMPSEIEWKLAELGAVINPPETAKLYAPLQEKEPYQGIKVTRDLKYGPDDRHALDVFVSEQAASAPRPVLMFVHGGAFTGGNKRGPDNSPFYDNIAPVRRPQRHRRGQHHLPAGAAASMARRRRGRRRRRALGRRQHRLPRRRSGACRA